MNYNKLFTTLIANIITLFFLIGCEQEPLIKSATPDPNREIVMEIGDTVDFGVTCTVENDLYNFKWLLSYKLPDYRFHVASGDKYTFTADLSNTDNIFEHPILSNHMFLKFSLQRETWNPVDSYDVEELETKVWKINIVQTPPIWEGDYIVWNDSDINMLRDFSEITGDLIFRNTEVLTSQDGLSNLVSIGGFLRIDENAQVTDLDGLSSVTSIGKGIHIIGSATLANIDGLSNVKSIGAASEEFESFTNSYVSDKSVIIETYGLLGIKTTVFISGNTALTNLDGLRNIDSQLKSIYLSNNSVLTDLEGISHVTSVGFLTIRDSALIDLKAFTNLTTIGYLEITNNKHLTSLDGLNSIAAFDNSLINIRDSSLIISNNPDLASIQGLSTISGSVDTVEIINNESLPNLEGLHNITSVENTLNIEQNASLTRLQDLDNLKLVRHFRVNGNATLISLGDFEQLTVVGTLKIEANPNLCTHLAKELADQLSSKSDFRVEILSNKICSTPMPD